jgi:alpha-L-rhamnosidase
MLYASARCAVADMYGYEELREKAEKIRKTVREMSFDGKFFHDQALRDESGELRVNGNISETCQYYAFYFGTADEEKYRDLKNTLLTEFGPDSENYPEIEKSNAFMGALLRMDLLVAWKKREMLIEQIKGYFLRMARLTGTLWEHKNVAASLNHGFPSYIAALLMDVVGTK